MDQNYKVQTNTKKSSTWVLACTMLMLFIIIFSLVGISLFFGFRYYKKETVSVRENVKEIVQPTKTAEDYTSQVIFKPEEDVVNLVSKVSPAVVTVVSKISVQNIFFETNQQVEQGVGTGFFISEDGLLITNEHVVCGANPKDLSIITVDKKTYTVDTIATDPFQDIAILKVNTNGNKVSFLKFANEKSKILIGQSVIAVGNPLGDNPGSVTKGIISGLERNIKAQGSCQNQSVEKDYEGVIQTDAPINSGNSGGPLINLLGEVIGVNSATTTDANSISYAIPADRILKLITKYENNKGKLTFPYIGVGYMMVDPNLAESNDVPVGALVKKVVEFSPAAKSGIQKGDIIIKIGDKTLDFSLQAVLNQYFEPGQEVEVEIFRPNEIQNQLSQGKIMKLKLVIGSKESGSN